MSRVEPGYVHRWFTLQFGDELSAELAGKLKALLGGVDSPSVDGLVEDLFPNLVYALELAVRVEHSGAVDLWIAHGAIEHIETLWPLVSARGWPHPSTGTRGLREAWLQRLDPEAAWELRAEVEERTEDGWRGAAGEDLAEALARDAIETGAALLALGDERGAVARQAGERWLEQLGQVDEVAERWRPIGEALAHLVPQFRRDDQ